MSDAAWRGLGALGVLFFGYLLWAFEPVLWQQALLALLALLASHPPRRLVSPAAVHSVVHSASATADRGFYAARHDEQRASGWHWLWHWHWPWPWAWPLPFFLLVTGQARPGLLVKKEKAYPWPGLALACPPHCSRTSS